MPKSNICWKAMIGEEPTPADLARIRAFSRFYTQLMGSLDQRHEGVDLTLVQARLLITIDSQADIEVGELARVLDLEATFVSRTLSTLEDRGLLTRSISQRDRRARTVALLPAGEAVLSQVIKRSNARVQAAIDHLNDQQVGELLAAMDVVQELLAPGARPTEQPEGTSA